MSKNKPVQAEPEFKGDVLPERLPDPLPPSGTVAVVERQQQPPAAFNGHHGALYPTLDTPLTQCPTNIDYTTSKGKAMLLAAGNPGDLEFDKEGKILIRATHYLIYAEERQDPDTGELSVFARTVLFDKDGNTFRTTAAHAPHRIKAALQLYSQAEWAYGVPLVIKERKGKRGFVYHDIRAIAE